MTRIELINEQPLNIALSEPQTISENISELSENTSEQVNIINEQPLNITSPEPQTISENISEQTNINVESTDGWYEKAYTETDPIFAQSIASLITEQDVTSWHNKSNFSGSYNDLTNKPTIPSKTSDLTNDSGFLTQHQDISGKVDKEDGKMLSTNDFTDNYKNNVDSNTSARHSHSNKLVLDDISSSDVSNWDSKQDNLVSGTNIKTINNQSLLGSGNIIIQGGGGVSTEWGSISGALSDQTDLAIALNSKADASSLSTVATSGSYNDLTNKPTIPTVPSTLSSFTDDLGSSPIHTHSQYLTQHQDISGKVDKETGKGLSTNDFTDAYKNNVDSNTSVRHTHSNKSVLDDISSSDITNWNNKSTFSGSYNDLTNKPTIPSKTSDLTNDSGFLTNIKTINNESLLGNGNINLFDSIYPVGSIYMSVNSTSPETLFGGTWQQIKDTFLLACGDTYSNGSTGGSADAVVVSHDHSINKQTLSGGGHTHTVSMKYRLSSLASGTGQSQPHASGDHTTTNVNIIASNTGTHSHTLSSHNTNNNGESGINKNMPPYLAVYVWERVS